MGSECHFSVDVEKSHFWPLNKKIIQVCLSFQWMIEFLINDDKRKIVSEDIGQL